MAAKDQSRDSKKRKGPPPASKGREVPISKKPKPILSKTPKHQETKDTQKPTKPFKSKFKSAKEKGEAPEKKAPLSKKELRLAAKEKAVERKKRRKPHYNLEQELASLWEKMRRRNIKKEERSKFISEALEKMRGKIPEIATCHVSSRVLQTCVKYCSPTEKDAVFEELRSHLLNLSSNAYAVHLVNKMLDNASKSQFEWFISSLHGHVSSLLRHMVGSVVVEHAFQLGNGSQKRQLLLELYSTELQLFKDLTLCNEGRLVDIISKLGLQKSSVLQHMTSVIQPILEKGIVDHTIIHTFLVEYFSVADRTSALEIIQQLSGALLVRLIHTKDGSKVGILCIKHGSAKERKKVIKGMKGLTEKIALDQYSSLVLVSILSVVDDTKLLTKIVIRELQEILVKLALDKNGRRPLLQLLNPQCHSYQNPDDLASLNLSIPSLCTQDDARSEKEVKSSARYENEHMDSDNAVDTATNTTSEKRLPLGEGGKKDPALRRYELLVNSGLAERLIDICIDNSGELLFSHWGKDVIYEVANGGAALCQSLSEKLDKLHESIASLAATPKTAEPDKKHVFVDFHANRTIRKLILSCPAFATTLWRLALEGRCEIWAEGHSLKVVSAYLESPDVQVRNLAKSELQPLVEKGVFKALESRHLTKEG